MTEYKKGDRVRITYIREGEVVDADNQRIWFQDDKHPMFPAAVYPISDVYATIEKLEDYNPEPKWVNGDVVKVGGWRMGYFWEGAWYSADRTRHIFSGAGSSAITLSDYWKRGEVEIIVRDDTVVAEKKVA